MRTRASAPATTIFSMTSAQPGHARSMRAAPSHVARSQAIADEGKAMSNDKFDETRPTESMTLARPAGHITVKLDAGSAAAPVDSP